MACLCEQQFTVHLKAVLLPNNLLLPIPFCIYSVNLHDQTYFTALCILSIYISESTLLLKLVLN